MGSGSAAPGRERPPQGSGRICALLGVALLPMELSQCSRDIWASNFPGTAKIHWATRCSRPGHDGFVAMTVPAALPRVVRACPVCGDTDTSARDVPERIDPARLGALSYASRKEPEYMRLRLVVCPSCDFSTRRGFRRRIPCAGLRRSGLRHGRRGPPCRGQLCRCAAQPARCVAGPGLRARDRRRERGALSSGWGSGIHRTGRDRALARSRALRASADVRHAIRVECFDPGRCRRLISRW